MLSRFKSLNWFVAAKATLVCLCLAVLGYAYDLELALTMMLGCVAAGLADNPDFYRRPLVSLATLSASFVIASLSVTLLFPWPPLFIIGLVGSSYLFMQFPKLGPNFAAVSLCSLIIAIYTMLGYHTVSLPLLQPLWLVSGAMCYALLSLLVNALRPTRLLDKQLDSLYRQLSLYQLTKARLFDPEAELSSVNQRLAEQKLAISGSLKAVRHALLIHQQNSRRKLNSQQMDRFFNAQVLFERMSSSHLDYQRIRDPRISRKVLAQTRRLLVKFARLIPLSQDKRHVSLPELSLDIEHLDEAYQNTAKRLESFGFLIGNLRRLHKLLAEPLAFPEQDYQFSAFGGLRLKQFIQQSLKLDDKINRHAFRMACVLGLGYGLVLLSGDDHFYWLMLSALLVTKPSYHETKGRFDKRVLGTLAGVVCASIFVGLSANSQLALLPLLVGVFFLYFHQNYAIAVLAVTVYVASSLGLQGQSADGALLLRLIATSLGALLALLAMRYLWPDWQSKRTPQILSEFLSSSASYLEEVVEQYAKAEPNENTRFRLARYNAQQSEAQLVEHSKNLIFEPKQQRGFSPKLYRLNSELHQLLSHISALSVHRDSLESTLEHAELLQVAEGLSKRINQLSSCTLSASACLEPMAMQQKLAPTLISLLPKLHGHEQLLAYQLQLVASDVDRIQKALNSIYGDRVSKP